MPCYVGNFSDNFVKRASICRHLRRLYEKPKSPYSDTQYSHTLRGPKTALFAKIVKTGISTVTWTALYKVGMMLQWTGPRNSLPFCSISDTIKCYWIINNISIFSIQLKNLLCDKPAEINKSFCARSNDQQWPCIYSAVTDKLLAQAIQLYADPINKGARLVTSLRVIATVASSSQSLRALAIEFQTAILLMPSDLQFRLQSGLCPSIFQTSVITSSPCFPWPELSVQVSEDAWFNLRHSSKHLL